MEYELAYYVSTCGLEVKAVDIKSGDPGSNPAGVNLIFFLFFCFGSLFFVLHSSTQLQPQFAKKKFDFLYINALTNSQSFETPLESLEAGLEAVEVAEAQKKKKKREKEKVSPPRGIEPWTIGL